MEEKLRLEIAVNQKNDFGPPYTLKSHFSINIIVMSICPISGLHPQSLTLEQQQMLMKQVQIQQQQIVKLQEQVQQFAQQQTVLENTPMFVNPPTNTQKLRHSEAYLR